MSGRDASVCSPDAGSSRDASITAGVVRSYPKKGLTKKVWERIQLLLKRGGSPCLRTETNCFGTIYFVLTGKSSMAPMPYPFVFLSMFLRKSGYKKTKEIQPFRTNERGTIVGLNPSMKNENFKRGDILVYNGKNIFGPNQPQHAAIYLWKGKEGHLVFYKMNTKCGKGVGYEKVTLESLLKLAIGLKLCDSPLKSIVVYR